MDFLFKILVFYLPVDHFPFFSFETIFLCKEKLNTLIKSSCPLYLTCLEYFLLERRNYRRKWVADHDKCGQDMLIAFFLTYITKIRRGHPEKAGMIISLPFAHWHNLGLTC